MRASIAPPRRKPAAGGVVRPPAGRRPRSSAQGARGTWGAGGAEPVLSRLGELILGFRGAQTLFAAVSLDLFRAASPGGSASVIAGRAGTDPRSTEVLLDALAAMGFLGKAGGRYRLTPEARAFLLPGAPGGLASNLLYQAKLVPDWSRLAETVRTGRPARGLVEILRSDPSFVRAYLEGMDEIARRPAAELARALDLSGALEMLDAGGGPGTYLRALLNAEPALRGTLLDLPEALRAARPFFAGWPGRRRVEFRAGDYRRTSFGRAGFDLVLLSHITHDEGEAANRALLAKAFQALRPGGQAVVHDFMVEPDRTRPLFGALFSVHMLTCTLEGRTYSRAEYESWLGDAGFKDLRAVELCAGSPNASTALVGRRPL